MTNSEEQIFMAVFASLKIIERRDSTFCCVRRLPRVGQAPPRRTNKPPRAALARATEFAGTARMTPPFRIRTVDAPRSERLLLNVLSAASERPGCQLWVDLGRSLMPYHRPVATLPLVARFRDLPIFDVWRGANEIS